MTVERTVGILFVCMGNICRSPTAQGVFEKLAETHGLRHKLRIDSAGTHAYHAGEAPDPRAINAAQKRGYELSHIRARKIRTQDFFEYDYVLAMDRDNLRFLESLNTTADGVRPGLLLEYHPNSQLMDVPDPYYGGLHGFEQVLDLVEEAASHLLKSIGRRHQL